MNTRDRRLAQEAERISRRVAAEHPDPEARRIYAWIAERAAAKREANEEGGAT